MARSASRHAHRKSAKHPPPRKNEHPFGLREPASVETVLWHRRAAIIVVALFAGILLWVALGPHKIGDYYTETDFYGSYADGARLIQKGHFNPSRYSIVGPVFEIAVAAIGFATRDLFRAAELVSVLAACGTLILWFGILSRRAGSGLALWTVLFLAANPTFFRYGYSATTDVLGTFMQAAALFFLLAGRRGFTPFWTGILAALAMLTRYNAIYLFPGGLLYYACFDRGNSDSRSRALVLFLIGLALVVLPWLGLSMQSGQMPGGALFHNVAFDVYAKSKGISWDQYELQIQPQIGSLRDVFLRDPGAVVRRELANFGQHLVLDAKLLLRWPIAAWCIFGLFLSIWDKTWRRLLPVWMLGVFLFITLVPAIHSERYSLSLAPIYLTLAGAAAASPRLTPVVRGWLLPIKWLPALFLLWISGTASFNTQRQVLSGLPIEILEAAKVLNDAAPQGARIMARKPHIAYYSKLTLVTFPVLSTLPELAQYCRREKVEFIYFSKPEADTRPEFTYLLNPQGTIPGLQVERFFPVGPAVLYRIEPGFGTLPAWFANDSLRTLHTTHALTSIGAAPWRAPLVCGNYAYAEGQFAAALKHFSQLAHLRPDLAEAYFMMGQSYANLHQLKNAEASYARALELQPDYPEARWGLGWTQLLSGKPQDAGRTWRPMIEALRDSSTLAGMITFYEKLGDNEAALAARETLRRSQQQNAWVP